MAADPFTIDTRFSAYENEGAPRAKSQVAEVHTVGPSRKESMSNFYKNPNAANDLSMMNISHMSQTFSQKKLENSENAPGMNIVGQEANKTYSFITNEDHEGLMMYLRALIKPIDLMGMVDSRGFTVLAYAAYRNQTNCFKILFEYAWRECFKVDENIEIKRNAF